MNFEEFWQRANEGDHVVLHMSTGKSWEGVICKPIAKDTMGLALKQGSTVLHIDVAEIVAMQVKPKAKLEREQAA